MRRFCRIILVLGALVAGYGCQPPLSSVPYELPEQQALLRTFPTGPMVFTPKTRFTYEVRYLGDALPIGEIELRVVTFEPNDDGFTLGIEMSKTLAGMRESKVWNVEVDHTTIRADGKPFLPQEVPPGDGWPSIDGYAGLLAYENVPTSVGRFEACWKVAYFEGPGEPSLFWFAPGVGLVKAEFPGPLSRLTALVNHIEP